MTDDKLTLAAAAPTSRRWLTRRRFLQCSGGLLLGAGVVGAGYYSTRDRIRIGLIGCGIRGSTLAEVSNKSSYYLWRYGNIVALADVNLPRAVDVRNKFCSGADVYSDHRQILSRGDVDAVIIAAPDHWHVAMALDALRAGKAIYHEKPFSHTIQESQLLRAAVKAAGLPFLVGTHQRGMWSCRTAAELVRNGRLGKVTQTTVELYNKGWRGGPFPTKPVPEGLDWDRWLGPTPDAGYCPERYEKFHGWWDYGGGEMMNWGSHHLDIAMWALDLHRLGLVKIAGSGALPKIPGGFDVPVDFRARLVFASGATIEIRTTEKRDRPSGILFEGEKSTLWVDRENLIGPAADELSSHPLPADAIRLHPSSTGTTLPTVRHFTHFLHVVRGLSTPVSDAESAHATNVALHLANIAIRVGRPIQWDPAAERIVGDPEAAALVSAPRRTGYGLAS